VFNVFSFAFYILFLHLLYPYLDTGITYNSYIFICGIVYIFTPFEYFIWNAKNVGLSARGFGLMLGHMFVFSIILYGFSGENYYLITTIVLAYLILLSSQFAFQFVCFFSIIFSLLTRDFSIVTIPFIAIIGFLLTNRKWSAIFFRRQWSYKKMYYKVLSWRFGLKLRYSIWRDFIYDFWTAVKQRGFVRGLEYIYRNPVVEVWVGFPALPVFAVLYFVSPVNAHTGNYTIIYLGILSALLIFLLTSFRLTRFLGEPQRYVEFVYPIICILPITFTNGALIATLVPCLVIIAFELIGIRLLAKRDGGGTTTHEKTLEVLNFFNSLNVKSDNKIASNNADVLKYFAQKDYRIMNINVTSEYTADLHFNEIFPETYGNMALKPLLHLAKHFKVNWLVLDLKLIGKESFQKEAGNDFKEIKTIHHYTIYKMC
jgi:hypothetical protein